MFIVVIQTRRLTKIMKSDTKMCMGDYKTWHEISFMSKLWYEQARPMLREVSEEL